MAVFLGSLIPKVQLALHANKVWRPLSILLECPGFKENFNSLGAKLKTKVRELNPIDGGQNVKFFTNLY